MEDMKNLGFASKQIHAGQDKNMYGALATPIYQTSTFVFDSAEQGGRRFALEEDGYIYTRLGNPTTTVIEKKLAVLEGAEACVSFSSGIGAITSCLWTALKAGDHMVAGKTLYGCTFAFMNHGLTRFGVDVSFVDMRNSENVKNAMKKTQRLFTSRPLQTQICTLQTLKKLQKLHTAIILSALLWLTAHI